MLVTLISEEKLISITLPSKTDGQYWLKDIISIEGIDGNWVLKSNKKVTIIDYMNGRKEVKNMILEPIQIYHLREDETQKELIIFTEPITDDREEFIKYSISGDGELTIGRRDDNNIFFSNSFVSSKHAKLTYRNGSFYLQDTNSMNGTFVNRERVDSTELELGDIIYIMGLKIIIGSNFIAMNNPDGKLIVDSPILRNYIPKKYKEFLEDDEEDDITEEFFTRSPRFKRDIQTANFNLASAPKGQNPDDTPAILTFGPSLTTGIGSMLSAVTSLATFQIPAAITSLGMLAGSIGWPSATKKYQDKIYREREEQRQQKYTEYLNQVKEKIQDEIASQKEILEENFISTRDCAKRIIQVDRKLWERTIDQNDFLKLRVGIGDTKLNANVNYQKQDFAIDTDVLDEQVRLLAEAPKIIEDVPIIVSFLQAYMSGVIGDRKKVIAFAKGLILQLVTYYGYDEVKLVFLYDEAEEEEFEFVKWLPHVWSDDRSFRFVATKESEVKEVSSYLEKDISKRLEMDDTELQYKTPYYVIFALSKDLSIRSDIVKRLTSIKRNLNFSLIAFFDELRFILKECSTVIEVGNDSKIYNKYDISGNKIEFEPDIYIKDDLTFLSTKLANIKLDLELSGDIYKLPSIVKFLEMYHVGKVEHLNCLTRWNDSNSARSLKAPIGINTNGNLFYLDAHEKFQGPHGLIAGMTGSGKSEFIISYILSLAVNYHPYDVSFLLIDYKGGGMAKALEKLPHVVGTITNLDGNSINRAILSLNSEIKRRQSIFNQAKEELGISEMDIISYQSLFKENRVKEPIPYLFIISDEFAELKAQQPEFMDDLISTARIGRSLGVQLILATQKPSGVVDDQIWSNARFRICLKVQDRADSMDMLKREEAAAIRETGRFYLQVGNNELFELGQSAWAGAKYVPQDKVTKETDNSIKILDHLGQIIREGRLETKKIDSIGDKRQIDAVRDYLVKIAEEENIHLRPLWLNPIEENIYLDDIKDQYEIQTYKNCISALIGEYDDPKNQRRMPFILSIKDDGNTAIYGITGSGVSMFLTTFIYSIIRNYKARDVGFYIMDFGAETLNVFKNAPHVGDVVFSTDKEKVNNLFKLLDKEMIKRKKLLSEYGGNINSYNEVSEDKLQKLFIIIHNYELFKESFEEEEDMLPYLTREGERYGLYFIITASSMNGFSSRVSQNFKQQIVLQQKDDLDYSSILNFNEKLIPARFKGRGLMSSNESVYEFQTAHVTDGDEQSFIRDYCNHLESDYQTKRIPLLPDKVTIDYVGDSIPENLDEVPIGIDTDSLDVTTYPFADYFLNIIFRQTGGTYQKFIDSILKMYWNCNTIDTYVLDINNQLKIKNKNCATNVNDCKEMIHIIQEENKLRNNTIKTAEEEKKEIPEYKKIVLFIHSYADLMSAIEDDDIATQELEVIMNKGQKRYNINIVIIEDLNKIDYIRSEDWYKQKFDNSNTIWLGNMIDDYYVNLITSTPRAIMDPNNEFGYVIKNGKPIRVKLLNIGEE